MRVESPPAMRRGLMSFVVLWLEFLAKGCIEDVASGFILLCQRVAIRVLPNLS